MVTVTALETRVTTLETRVQGIEQSLAATLTEMREMIVAISNLGTRISKLEPESATRVQNNLDHHLQLFPTVTELKIKNTLTMAGSNRTSRIEQDSITVEQDSTITKTPSAIQPLACTINPLKTVSVLPPQTALHLRSNTSPILAGQDLVSKHKDRISGHGIEPGSDSLLPSMTDILLNQESKKILVDPGGGDVEATTLKLGQCLILVDPGGDAGDKSNDGKFLRNPQSYIIEIVCVSFLIVFAINYFTGKRENENLALAWVAKFALKDSGFEHYSLLGVGEAVGEGDDSSLLLKEGQTMFKFYASSRRYCQGFLATMEPKSRDGLISRLYNRIVTCKDEICFEVYMNDEAMDHVVFALAKKKAAKGMQKELGDLQWYASLMSPPSNRKWIVDELAVITEPREVASDLIIEVVLDQVFDEKAYEKFDKGFISMQFSDQERGTHKKMLLFKFALLDVKNMVDITSLVALVPYYIYLIGRYKLSSQARSKTGIARSQAAQETYKELQNARQGALQKKKAERKKMWLITLSTSLTSRTTLDTIIFGGLVNAWRKTLEETDLYEDNYLLFNFNYYPKWKGDTFQFSYHGNFNLTSKKENHHNTGSKIIQRKRKGWCSTVSQVDW